MMAFGILQFFSSYTFAKVLQDSYKDFTKVRQYAFSC